MGIFMGPHFLRLVGCSPSNFTSTSQSASLQNHGKREKYMRKKLTILGFERGFTCLIRGWNFYGRQTTLKATSNKMVKHEKTCSNNQHSFISFTFDTLDFLNTKDCWSST